MGRYTTAQTILPPTSGRLLLCTLVVQYVPFRSTDDVVICWFPSPPSSSTFLLFSCTSNLVLVRNTSVSFSPSYHNTTSKHQSSFTRAALRYRRSTPMLVEEPALLLLSVDTTAVRVILEPYLVQSRRGGMHHFYNRHAMPVHPQGVMVIGIWADAYVY